MHGQADAVVSAFVDLTERAGPEHLARLEALVAERRRKLGRSRGQPGLVRRVRRHAPAPRKIMLIRWARSSRRLTSSQFTLAKNASM